MEEQKENIQRESVIVYRSWMDAIREMPRDIRGDVLIAIVEYGLYGETTENPKPLAKAFLTMAKPIIDTNNKRYQNGCKGGRKGGNKPNVNQPETESEPNDKEKDKVKEKDFFSKAEKKAAKKILFEMGIIGKQAENEMERFAAYNIAKGIDLKNKVAGLKLWDISVKERIPKAAVKIMSDFCKIAGDEFTESFLNDVSEINMDEDGICIVCTKSFMDRMESVYSSRKEDFDEWRRKKKFGINYKFQ